MQILLPWPPSSLSSNARSRTWHKAAAAKKAYRKLCGLWAMAAGVRKMDGPLAVTVTFNPPDKRRRDDDNMIASFKAGRDGIADVCGVDDADWAVDYVFGVPVKSGAVTVALQVAR